MHESRIEAHVEQHQCRIEKRIADLDEVPGEGNEIDPAVEQALRQLLQGQHGDPEVVSLGALFPVECQGEHADRHFQEQEHPVRRIPAEDGKPVVLVQLGLCAEDDLAGGEQRSVERPGVAEQDAAQGQDHGGGLTGFGRQGVNRGWTVRLEFVSWCAAELDEQQPVGIDGVGAGQGGDFDGRIGKCAVELEMEPVPEDMVVLEISVFGITVEALTRVDEHPTPVVQLGSGPGWVVALVKEPPGRGQVGGLTDLRGVKGLRGEGRGEHARGCAQQEEKQAWAAGWGGQFGSVDPCSHSNDGCGAREAISWPVRMERTDDRKRPQRAWLISCFVETEA